MVEKQNRKLTTEVKRSEITDEICKIFDYKFKDKLEFTPHILPWDLLPKDFNIGLIVGTSGGGKTTLLKEFGKEAVYNWDSDEAIASQFKSKDDAIERLSGVGFSSVPQWLLPYKVLSNGQKYRADLAININSNTVFDEFTSVVDRPTALSMSNSVAKYIRKNNLTGVVFAAPHFDIIDYLQPDWVYNVDEKTLTINNIHKEDMEKHYLDENLKPIGNSKYFMSVGIN